MARKDTDRNPAEQNNERGIGMGDEGRMPAGPDDLRGAADEGEDALDDDEDIDEDEEEEEGDSF
jgi:hypothetical protein